MNKQLKNRLTKGQVIAVLERYLSGEIGVTEAMALWRWEHMGTTNYWYQNVTLLRQTEQH